MLHRLFRLRTLGSLILITSGMLCAQNRNVGEIRGTVTDSSGAVVPDVLVTITNTATGITSQVRTGQTGVYDAPTLQPGDYSIIFVKEGFKKYVRSGLVLHVEAITIDAVLAVGAASEQVTVLAEAPLVQTETSEKRVTLTSQTITELPNVGRDWYELTGQLPGVNPGPDGENFSASGQNVGINGNTSFVSNWLIDGGVGMFPVSQNPDLLSVPLEAINEVDLTINNFNAEYGNGVAVFNVITKSGTNQFHGSAFEYVQNDKFMARNFFAEDRTPLRWNQFGGTIGGPIKRDKAFFFFSFERTPTNTFAPNFYTFPTDAMKRGDFSNPDLPVVYDPASLREEDGGFVRDPFPDHRVPTDRLDPVSGKIQEYFPKPNRDGIYNNYYFVSSDPLTTTKYNARVDYNLSAKHQLFGSYMYVPVNERTPAPTCPMDCGTDSIREQQAQITHVWTPKPTLVNQFRGSFIREYGIWSAPNMDQGYPEKIGLKNAAADVFPSISIQGDVETGISGGLHALLGFSSYVASDTLTWVHGKHILKFGGEFNKLQQNQAWDDKRSGDFEFSGILTRNPADDESTGLGYADFFFGLPDAWGVNMSPVTGGRNWNAQFYAQDDYKITPKLTLNLGLRYAVQAGWSEVHNRISMFDPNLTNPATGTKGALWFAGQGGRKALQKTLPDIFQPRLGFAWAPKSNWSVRGGYGMFNIMWGGNSYAQGLGSGWAIQGDMSSTDSVHPIFSLVDGPPAPFIPSAATRTPDMLNGQGVTYFPYDTPASYVHQWHFSLQHQFAGDVMVEAGYVGSKGVHMGFGRDINQVPANLLGEGDAQPRRPYSQYQDLYSYLFDGYSNYHALQMTARKQMKRGVTLIANYTYSKAMDTSTGSGWGGTWNGTDAGSWQDAHNVAANYGLSSVDLRHLLNGSVIWELPVGQGRAFLNQGGIVNAVLGGWQLSSTFQLHTGLPFTPIMGDTDLSGSLAGTWRPNRIGSGTLSHPTIDHWFDYDAFKTPAPFTLGNSGRNILSGPGFKNANFSLAKSFRFKPLGEAGDLQVRGDFYNVFNHPNFALPNYEIGTPGAGIIETALTARKIQLGMRLKF